MEVGYEKIRDGVAFSMIVQDLFDFADCHRDLDRGPGYFQSFSDEFEFLTRLLGFPGQNGSYPRQLSRSALPCPHPSPSCLAPRRSPASDWPTPEG